MTYVEAPFAQQIFEVSQGKRISNITAKRMILGLVLKYRNGLRFVMRLGRALELTASYWFPLTRPENKQG